MTEWLRAFIACPSTAFHHVPEDVYSKLRSEGYLEADNTLTAKALTLAAGAHPGKDGGC